MATSNSLSTIPISIRPSSHEITSSQLDDRNLEMAVRHMHQDGLVVVQDVIPHDHLDHLNSRMIKDARTLQARGENGPFNYNVGNLQQDAPPVAEYFYASIFTSEDTVRAAYIETALLTSISDPIATQITSAVLGPKPKWTFCSANSAMPPLPGGSPKRQPVHSDADFNHPAHPFALVVNIPLITMAPENGSTEVWLGTHGFDVNQQEGAHGERTSGRIKEALLAERRGVRAPSQPIVKKGSIIIRDLRLWHAGMPNRSDEVRVMLAMIHFAAWYRNPMRLEFGRNVKPILDDLEKGGKLGLEVPVDWVKTEEVIESYLNRGFGNSYDFNQTP